jgi:hypothetical protein
MSDSMVGNRKFRTFNVMDDGSREVLAIEVDTSLSAKESHQDIATDYWTQRKATHDKNRQRTGIYLQRL